MSKRKGVSLDEKRKRMQDLFYEKKEFFQLKELEKLGPKEKGVIAQSVKDVVQRKRRLTNLQEELEGLKAKYAKCLEEIKKESAGKKETSERTRLIADVKGLEAQKSQLISEKAKYLECSPEFSERMKKETKDAVNAANRWTDNVFNIKSWCKKNFGIDEADIDQQYEIPSDFDYI